MADKQIVDKDDDSLITMEELMDDPELKALSPETRKHGIQIWALQQVDKYLENGRLANEELYELTKDLTQSLILVEHRCATIQNICVMLSQLGISREIARQFFESNIKKEQDCKECSHCFEMMNTTDESDDFILAYPSSGSGSFH